MCGGSGGGSSVKAPDPMIEAQAEIKRMQEQYKLDQRAQVAAAQRTAAQEAAARTQWSGDLGTARTGAQRAMEQQFREKGLDPADYQDRIMAALDLEQSGKAYGTTPAFSTDLANNTLGSIRNSTIRDYTGAINKFAPEGFETGAFADTADDAVIAAILGEQFGTASDTIMRAKERGNLDDTGFRYAMDNLNTQKSAANARLQDTGGGILGGYRGQLTDIVGKAKTGASSWDFGDTFNPTVYQKQLTGKQGELGGRLEGDIRNAIGGEQFFNVDDLISKGITGQGAVNTGAGGQGGSLLAALTQQKKDEEQQRGLGTQGSF